MAAEGERTSADKSSVQVRDTAADRSDDTAGMSLVDFCVQLDDCTPTVSTSKLYR